MNKLLSLAAVVALSIPVLAAGIHAKATSTSHALAQVSEDLHGHMHHAHGASYGAHDMENTAIDAHDALHDYDQGGATVEEVLAAVDAANAAFDALTEGFNENGVLTGPDQDKEAKKLYHKVHSTLAKLNAYVASAK